MTGIAFGPGDASTLAPQVNALFYALLAFSLALGTFLTLLVVVYSVKYRKGSDVPREGGRLRPMPVEIGWTSATLLTAFAIFAWSAHVYMDHVNPPPGAIVISGLAKQWMWKFRHPGGQREIDELHVPLGRPVVLELGSQDVIHSFFVPAFRVKQDVVPGRGNRLWFTASKVGRYHLFCAEYCGTEHSEMIGSIEVMEPEDYASWLAAQGEGETLAEGGERLFHSFGCSGCHGQSAQVRAPDLAGIWNRPVALASGETVIADAAYVRDSVLMPDRQVAAGYRPIMPSFAGLIDEEELQMIQAYVESLGGQP
ncbi:Cytochrome c oxidase polypeptide II [Rubellimicrobium mesophilum DSM 19309]|uniref:cytochrome-c oxidase n=1 Tax=Rubellimicrobium mesophilum DSM 19309 TaxID=442562 RepID=A0A017HJH4_9RHOB|nr:cytochrome c oxidase subunit II [Rubellimicrobium mesophilum]EYD73934.1 Cytochrome c oxidase polypeptide II [Rubellimicrobium mesophilum DSM 19309]